MLEFLGGIVVGAIVGGFVIKNNKDKAFAALESLKTNAEAELIRIKKELDKLKKS